MSAIPDLAPPALSRPEAPLSTYLKAAAIAVPALLFWLFADSLLLPRLDRLCQVAGLPTARAQGLLDASHTIASGIRFAIPAAIALCVFLELRVPAWTRYRRTVISTVTVCFQTIVLLGLTVIAVVALIAAPRLLKVAEAEPATPTATQFRE